MISITRLVIRSMLVQICLGVYWCYFDLLVLFAVYFEILLNIIVNFAVVENSRMKKVKNPLKNVDNKTQLR